MIAVRNLSIELGGRRVLSDVNLTLEAGEVVGLLGPNGAGKTTLMRAICGLLAPTSGEVALGGQAIGELVARERALRLAFLPQGRTIGWGATVERLVALGRLPWLAFGELPGGRDREICVRAMEMADVAHLAARPATELSGGEQARVLAARAIAQDTPMLVADEPVAGLDPAHQIAMMRAFRRLAGEGRGVLVSLHDIALAALHCDRLVVLHGGRVAAEGRPEDVLTPANLATIFGVEARLIREEGRLLLLPTGLAARGAS